ECRQVVFFVEEAQGMPLATLEEILLLSNLETKHDKLLQIVLFGQPELDVNLNQTHIRQLRERITHSFNLGPLTESEVGEYLIFRLRAAGYYGPHLFSKSAIRMIAKSSEGLVRRVNILADKALLATFSDNAYQVTPKHVKAAIKDSEFGAEQVKNAGRQKLFLAAAAILLLGLGLGYLMNTWQMKLTSPALVAEAVPEQTSLEEPATAPVEAQVTVELPEMADEVSLAEPEIVEESIVPESVPVLVEVSDDLLQRRLNMTQQWLTQQPTSTVSIQLMGSGNDDQLRTQLESLASKVEIDNIYVYRTQVNNNPFLTVLYGSYESRQEALVAMRSLPESLRSYKPHLRTVGGILQETKSMQ
ncbi:MAG: SPOR domain-containing protein, partial [Methylophilaceae bacterium]|nr:SPOR domain-containing protein [Methylophilaceae bacterium]